MTSSRYLTDDEKTWENLYSTFYTLQRAREIELAKVGLSIPQAGILHFLATSKEALTPMKLSRLMGRQPHTIGALVVRMEAQGLVQTTHDLKRKNWVRVSLTNKGPAGLQASDSSAQGPQCNLLLVRRGKGPPQLYLQETTRQRHRTHP